MGNISLGKAILVLTTEAGAFIADLDNAEAHAHKLRDAIQGVGKGLKTVGKQTTDFGVGLTTSVTAPIVGVIGGLAALALSSARAGDEIGETAAEAGLSTDRWQEYGFALSQVSRISEDQLAKGFANLTKMIGEASAGGKKQIKVLEDLGFSQKQIADGTITTEAAFERLRVSLVKAESPAQALVLAGDALGDRVGPKLAGAIRTSNDQIDVAIQKHKELGLGMSGAALKAASDFQDKIDLVTREFTALAREVGAEVMPIITETLIPFLRETAVPIIRSVVDVLVKVVDWFGKLPKPVQQAALIIAGLVAAIGPVLVVAGTLISAIGTMVTAFGAVAPIVTAAGAAIAAIGAGPLLLIVGAIAGVVLAWKNWDSIKGIIDSVWGWIKSFVTDKVAPLLKVAGPLLGPIGLVLTVWQNWDKISTIVQNVYNAVKTWLVDKFTAILASIEAKIDAVVGFFRDMKDKIVGHSFVPELVNGIEAEFNRLQTVMVDETRSATRGVEGLFGSMFSGLMSKLPGWLQGIVGQFQGEFEGLLTWLTTKLPTGLGGIVGMFQSAFTGPAGALGAVKSFATKGLETLLGMIPVVGPFISKLAGPIIAGFGKIAGAIKNLFGGPSADELGGREIVQAFERNLNAMLTETQRLDAGNEQWKMTIIALRDKYIALGLTEAEALIDAKRLWDSSRDGADASRRVIEEIMRKLEGGFVVPVNFDVGPLNLPDAPGVDVERMQHGGIGRVTRPTLFLAGEAGAEDFAFSGGGKSFQQSSMAALAEEIAALRRSVVDVVSALRRDFETTIPQRLARATVSGLATAQL